MKKLSLNLFSLLIFFSLSQNINSTELKVIYGDVKVIDGDTVIIKNSKIRLFGIDAPEKNQICIKSGKPYNCGNTSTNYLRSISDMKWICSYEKFDRYGRILGKCDTLINSQKTEDKNSNILGRINKYMVCNGQAVAYTRYSYEYFECENTAKKNKIGIWAGEFDRPEDWRRKYN